MPQHSQYRQCEEIVAKIQRILGNFAGYRAQYADGRLYRGWFVANAVARHYTRASHMQGAQIPVTVRFSRGCDPLARFGVSVGMAARFYCSTGKIAHLVMLNHKLFVARTVEQFMALLDAALPADSAAAQSTNASNINLDGLNRLLAEHPASLAACRMRIESPAPVSFAHTEFSAVHAFLFRNAADVVTAARCHWTPVAGIRGQPPGSFAPDGIDTLFVELEDRIERAVVEFDLQLELAEEGDPLDDATALWPADRRRVAIGRLTITDPILEEQVGDPVMNHDPTVLTDGIEATDDPILQIRRGVYEVSAALRSGGWSQK